MAKAGLATHAHFNALSRCSGSEYVWHIFGLALGCYGRFWFPGSTWFRPTSAAFSDPHHFERNPQIMDTNHSAFLRDTDRLNEFKIALNNRFQALQDLLKEEEPTMKGNWKGMKEALTSTCQEVLGLKKHRHKEWISIETLEKIKERKNKKAAINNSRTRAEKVQAQAEYIEANSN
ncbi:unnamed protein product [Schistosoma mattheei]|uniref:Uncharacterized protein n=1 Tax=Schistosoma mattheei TaxID=31246 RepID=A0A3P8FXR5_9TREM|nr:unnamed protein product [Schistosoma mattheei]